jgi:hypothetical protein
MAKAERLHGFGLNAPLSCKFQVNMRWNLENPLFLPIFDRFRQWLSR